MEPVNGYIRFKTERLHNEWAILDPRLRAALFEVARFVRVAFGKSLFLTCILRTPEENADAGGVPDSGHLLQENGTVRAADVRTAAHLTAEEIERVVEYWDEHIRLGRGWWSCLYHGQPRHLHMQVPHRERG